MIKFATLRFVDAVAPALYGGQIFEAAGRHPAIDAKNQKPISRSSPLLTGRDPPRRSGDARAFFERCLCAGAHLVGESEGKDAGGAGADAAGVRRIVLVQSRADLG